MIQDEVDRVVHESGNCDPIFAAGVEAGAVWNLLGQNLSMPGGDKGEQIILRTLNREMITKFAEWHDYNFILWRDMGSGMDWWRFTKRAM